MTNVTNVTIYNTTLNAELSFTNVTSVNLTNSIISMPVTTSDNSSLSIFSSMVNGTSINSQGDTTLQNVTFTDCTQAVSCQGTLSVDNCIFNNSRGSNGSGLCTSFTKKWPKTAIYATGDTQVFNSVFVNNIADLGSAASIYNNATLHVVNSTFYNESTGSDNVQGTSIYAVSAHIYNSTFEFCTAYSGALESSGLIYVQNDVHVENCLFQNNNGSSGTICNLFHQNFKAWISTQICANFSLKLCLSTTWQKLNLIILGRIEI